MPALPLCQLRKQADATYADQHPEGTVTSDVDGNEGTGTDMPLNVLVLAELGVPGVVIDDAGEALGVPQGEHSSIGCHRGHGLGSGR
ncbi:hypothetical protein OG612_21210 [Streptomyces sp. NBC_01527]|uniref:hypothetical protein n=1 Tax=Streptomyces sp. NBC_01527 TaxID=2903894 RepID=UPI003867ED3C